MGYDSRGYYYRSHRTPNGPRKEYIHPSVAPLTARVDGYARAKREAERARYRALVEAEQAAEAALNDYAESVRLLTGAALVACGFHRHRRTWRLRRNKDG